MSLILECTLLGLVLSADSFSAAISMGFRPFGRRDALLYGFVSGGSGALITWLGALAGVYILAKISAYDHWVAFFLLGGVSVHMFYEGVLALKHGAPLESQAKFHRLSKVLLVSLVTSFDAMGVGMGLGLANKPILPYLIAVGVCAFVATLLGLYLARRLSRKFGPVVTLLSALILGVLSFQMLKI